MTIKNFRCLKSVRNDFDLVTTFIGPNSAGKFSIFRDPDRCFNGGTLTHEDVYADAEEVKIVVQVDFNYLTSSDREKLGKYGYNTDQFTAWKIWDNGAEKITGKAFAYDPFKRIRAAGTTSEKRRLYSELANDCKAELFAGSETES